MKWVVLVIVVFIAGYTAINIRYRKPGRAYEPAAEMHQRVSAARLKAAGWEKISASTRRPAEKSVTADARITRGNYGPGLDFNAALVDQPSLFKSIDQVSAPARVEHDADYTACFTVSIDDLKLQLGDILLYRRGYELMLMPVTEHLPGRELYSRWNDASYCVTFSTRGLPAGRYQISVVAHGPAAKWSFEIK